MVKPEIDRTLFALLWPASSQTTNWENHLSTRTSQFSHYKGRRRKITLIQTGSPSRLTPDQVCHTEVDLDYGADPPSDFRTNKPSDIVSTLVSIYDSKDLFVKELQILLAQRLLAVTDGNYDREVRVYRICMSGIAAQVGGSSGGTLRFSRLDSESLLFKSAK